MVLTDRRYEKYKFSGEINAKIRPYYKSDNWHSLLALLEDYVIVGLMIAACHYVSWWFYPVAVLVIGARQRGLSTVLHDAAHGVGASSKKLRLFIGTALTAYPIFQKFHSYKKSHVHRHHPFLGDPNRDPDLAFYHKQGVYKRAPRKWYIAKNILLPAVGTRIFAYFEYLIENRLKRLKDWKGPKNDQRKEQKTEGGWERYTFSAFWVITLALLVYFGVFVEFLLFWLVPYVTAFHILGWYIELSEHTPHLENEEVDLYMSRNRKSRGLEKFLTGIHNDDFHLAHHLNPAIPFWNLPKAHQVWMEDENYAAVDAKTGGLFTKGVNGTPSAMRVMVEHFSQENQGLAHGH